MKKNAKASVGLNPQFIIDAQGKKTAVILDIRTYERLVEHIQGLYLGFMGAEKTSSSTASSAKSEASQDYEPVQMYQDDESPESISF